ncbi:CBS domain-containing protein [Nitrincola tapanii]|uniref:CBS domain-containing protein n=1 Tax=Nitrincola tapanii TaxID=1708751 RepID=A0A5A9W2J0_9GAMM|nr:CBS domain-containing protein [Nitrincola tapanii]KAA0874773.1 CBS domain-containing protein [Nitrincola tapanii]
MSLIIIDQGNRIQTPLRSIFKPRGVEGLTESKNANATPGFEDQLQGSTSGLIRLETDVPKRAPSGSAQIAYEEASKAGKPKPRPTLKASQIMTFPVHTTGIANTLRQAWALLEEHAIAHLVVINEEEEPLGLLSRQDVLLHGTDSTVTVAVVYQKQILVATNDTEISQIARIFVQYPIGAIPVIGERNELLGIISRTDLVRLLINDAQVESWA